MHFTYILSITSPHSYLFDLLQNHGNSELDTGLWPQGDRDGMTLPPHPFWQLFSPRGPGTQPTFADLVPHETDD